MGQGGGRESERNWESKIEEKRERLNEKDRNNEGAALYRRWIKTEWDKEIGRERGRKRDKQK